MPQTSTVLTLITAHNHIANIKLYQHIDALPTRLSPTPQCLSQSAREVAPILVLTELPEANIQSGAIVHALRGPFQGENQSSQRDQIVLPIGRCSDSNTSRSSLHSRVRDPSVPRSSTCISCSTALDKVGLRTAISGGQRRTVGSQLG
ncbi:hypothetical protein NEOLEDRAFT_1132993 [Neolentinus lepideus HHB14362 ss-1]|uniref:Uncharacterized protein n=1 Tax=Neolentinus lepideus HHB14362 ss-1 TaxID=1314782 RepID=A0A165T085_9AGAM|nr:hypothetical protein NEOLEDRAFT_1132993 [Neolentinus lepideus HHB14362 ss-1]